MGQHRRKLSLGVAATAAALVAVPVAVAATSRAPQAPRPGRVTPAARANTTPLTTTTGTSSTPAGSVAVNSACYVDYETTAAQITISGANWSPGDTIELTDDRQHISATVTATSTGTFTTTVPAPIVPNGDADVSDQIQAVDEGSEGATTPGGASAQSAPFLTTRYEVTQAGNSSDPFKKTIFALSGFPAHRTVYAHYLTRRGKFLANASLGRPDGACGMRRVAAYEYPGGKAQRGSYTIQFDDSAHYRARTAPQYRLNLDITRL